MLCAIRIVLALCFLSLSGRAFAEDMKVPREALQATVDYLIKQPYKDVFGILDPLLRATSVNAPDPKPPADDKTPSPDK